jgi:hypothetical protein
MSFHHSTSLSKLRLILSNPLVKFPDDPDSPLCPHYQKVQFGRMLFLLISGTRSLFEPLQLNDTTFDSLLVQSPVTFVMASRNDLPVCQNLLVKFRAVGERFKDQCQFGVLEGNVSQAIIRRFRIIAFPSLILFRGNQFSAEYDGEPQSAPMAAFIERILGDHIVALDSARDVHEFLERHRVSVILAGEVFDPELANVYSAVAENLSDSIPFAKARTADAIQQLGLEDVPSLQIHRGDDRKVIDCPLEFGVTFTGLRQWVLEHQIPRYHRRSSVVLRALALDGRYSLMAFVDTSRKASLDLVHETLDQLVSAYGENFTYVYSDIFDVGTVVLQLGFSGAREPVYCIVSIVQSLIHDPHLFPELRRATPENVIRWAGQVLNATGHGRPTSESVVEGQTGPLFKIVGSQFKNVTQDPRYDVVTAILNGEKEQKEEALVLMNETALEYQKQNIAHVKFNHIDMSLNDLPEFANLNWTSPVILWWPAGNEKTPLRFPHQVNVLGLMHGIRLDGKAAADFRIPWRYDQAYLEL